MAEVEMEFAPTLGDRSLADQLDALLRRVCSIARAMTGAEQAALKLCIDGDPASTRKYFNLSSKYADYENFRVDPKGVGLHGMEIPQGQTVRMTQEEVLDHPLFQNFGPLRGEHPPMRGWLASGVYGADGRNYGLLQLSDKGTGGEFDADDESHVRELAALVGEALDALRMASAAPAR